MLRRILFIGGACLGMALMVSPAFGARNVPKKANKYQATLVQGTIACTATNTTAPGLLATPACDPVVPADPGCVFEDNGGGGLLKAKSKDDISVQAKVKKVDAACEGETLCAVAGISASYDTCASSGNCTAVTSTDLALGASCVTIEKGKGKFKGTINGALPGALVTGERSEFILGEIGLLRTGAGSTAGRANAAFRAGLLLP